MLRKRCRKFVVGTLADELREQMSALGLKDFDVIPELADEAGNMISTDADPTVIYDKDYRERISFLPPESCIEAWRADYSELLMHFVYGNKLTFDELLERVGELNRRFNGVIYV